MIKVLAIEILHDFEFELTFSNGESGLFDLKTYLSTRKGPLLEPLYDKAYSTRCFIDAGALCWPNGFELSGERVFELSRVHA